MIDERDLTQEKQCYYQERSQTVIKNLEKRNISGLYAASREDALDAIMALIPPGAVVVRGDSMSLDQVGVLEAIKQRNQNTLIDAFERDAEGKMTHEAEERYRMERAAFTADVFITGSNAITLDGKIVNTDGKGNRVAPIIFGPRKVILVIGANKIVGNEEEARQRIRDIAAPMNVIRHLKKYNEPGFSQLPCARTGRCMDCSHELRICRYTVVIEGAMQWDQGRINVVLVGEELGI